MLKACTKKNKQSNLFIPKENDEFIYTWEERLSPYSNSQCL